MIEFVTPSAVTICTGEIYRPDEFCPKWLGSPPPPPFLDKGTNSTPYRLYLAGIEKWWDVPTSGMPRRRPVAEMWCGSVSCVENCAIFRAFNIRSTHCPDYSVAYSVRVIITAEGKEWNTVPSRPCMMMMMVMLSVSNPRVVIFKRYIYSIRRSFFLFFFFFIFFALPRRVTLYVDGCAAQ